MMSELDDDQLDVIEGRFGKLSPVDVLLVEVRRARAEVDRLTDGIREHREAIAGASSPDARLWSLLDVAGDDSCPECWGTGLIRLGTDELGDDLACVRCAELGDVAGNNRRDGQ